MKALNALSIIIVLISQDVPWQTTVKVTSDDLPEKIKVPLVNYCQVKTDGLFLEDEWKGALNLHISESFEILFLSDPDYLYIGLKYAGKVADYKQPLDCVSEVYIAINDAEFCNLHSSDRLAEGVNKFSADLKQAKYSLDVVNGWEANSGSHVRDNDLNCNGVEYKISRKKIAGHSIKMAAGILAVNFSFRESGNFPADFGFDDADKWMELII
ncbi:hypothetical protein EG832_11880, partial [bacterium]|nr:hypothetical protein [bacterium]